MPRWVSLKFGRVNARTGPGDDYPAAFAFNARRLPVQVVEETRDWRKVCDPEGGSSWVHRRTVDGKRTVFRVEAQPLAMRARPETRARVKAWLAGRAVADLDRCEGGWCRIEVEGAKGWAPAAALWGLKEAAVCR